MGRGPGRGEKNKCKEGDGCSARNLLGPAEKLAGDQVFRDTRGYGPIGSLDLFNMRRGRKGYLSKLGRGDKTKDGQPSIA